MDSLTGFDCIAALGRAVDSRPLDAGDSAFARSVIDQWSANDGRLSKRQWWKVQGIVANASPVAATEQTVADYVPVPATGLAWWRDTSSKAQARRGLKSGAARRTPHRRRDRKIEYLVNACGMTVRAVAKLFGLAASTVSRIASGKRFWKPRKVLLPEPSLKTPRCIPPARPPEQGVSRNVAIFRSLRRWAALEVVRGLPDVAVVDEAMRLNALLSRPLRPNRVRQIARSVNSYR